MVLAFRANAQVLFQIATKQCFVALETTFEKTFGLYGTLFAFVVFFTF